MRLTSRQKFAMAICSLTAMPVIAVAVLSFGRGFAPARELPVYGEVPAFRLVERNGGAYGSADLRGKVWIANFIFTHCAGQCPLVSAKMQRVQGVLRLKENLRLLSFSVDPERDTPAVLSEYARRFQADPYKWLFLTGEKKSVYALIKNGFRLTSEAEGSDILHSFKLVLVDAAGRIRGYYDGEDDKSVDVLLDDAKILLRQSLRL